MDRTADFQAAVTLYCMSSGLDQTAITKLKSSKVLKAIQARTPFSKSAASVAENINKLRAFIVASRRDYLLPGKLTDKEKDHIENEVGLYVKSITQHIDQLKNSVLHAQQNQAPSPTKSSTSSGSLHNAPKLSAQNVAHLHGVVLILAEHLGEVSALFDSCRAQRYSAIMELERSRQAAAQKAVAYAQRRQPGATGGALPTDVHPAGGGGTGAMTALHAQQQMNGESAGMVALLQARTQQVRHLERTMRDVAALNQMFSTAVLAQAAAIETVYQAAVEASEYVEAGNKDLVATIAINRTTRMYLLVMFMVLTLGLLFYDWFHS